MKQIILILLLCLQGFSVHAQSKTVSLVSPRDAIHNPNGPHSGIPIVSYNDDEVTVSCDSVINNVDIVIRDQFGNVMHQSTQTITPMESTIFVPDTGDGSEKCTIDLYYDRRHLSGTFEE